MKFLKNRTVAFAITALVIVGCLIYGMAMTRWNTNTSTIGETAPDQAIIPDTAGSDYWISDEAGVLSTDTKDTLSAYNAAWDAGYSSVLAVATVDSTNGEDIEAYAYDYGTDWGLGQNDMLLLLAIDDNEFYFILSGTEVVPDERVETAFYSAFYDAYVDGDYDAAFTGFFAQMDTVYGSYAGWTGSAETYYAQGDPSGGGISPFGAVVLLVILYWIVSAIDRARYRRWYARYGTLLAPPVFVPILFWHRPGGTWFRRMDAAVRRPPGGPHGPGGPGGHGGFGGSGFGGSRGGGYCGSSFAPRRLGARRIAPNAATRRKV